MSESNDTDAGKNETIIQKWNDGMLLDPWADDRIQESLETPGRNIVVYRRRTDGLPERTAQIKSLQQHYKKAQNSNQ